MGKKSRKKKYAILYFYSSDIESFPAPSNWLLLKYGKPLDKKGTKAYLDSDAKIIYRTEINKKAVSITEVDGYLNAKFNETHSSYFQLYIDKDDGDIVFDADSDEEAILFALAIDHQPPED